MKETVLPQVRHNYIREFGNEIGITVGILGIFGADRITAQAKEIGGFIVDAATVISLMLILFALLMLNSIRKKLVTRAQTDVLGQKDVPVIMNNNYCNDILIHSHLLVHKIRDHWHEFLLSAASSKKITEDEIDVIKNKMYQAVTHHVLKTLCSILKLRNIEINDDIRITIKIIVKKTHLIGLLKKGIPLNRTEEELNNCDTWVITAFRDNKTYQQSRSPEVNFKVYEISRKNTAYFGIFTRLQKRGDCDIVACPNNNDSRCACANDLFCPIFSSDNLLVASESNKYNNENTDWKNTYNSTAIVPIRVFDNKRKMPYFFGALSVDSRNGANLDLYNNRQSYEILAHAADVIALILRTIEVHVLLTETPGDTE